MNKICLANPPAYLYDSTRHWIQAGSRWSFSMDAEKGNHKWPHYQPYPFYLGYATSILEEEGFEVSAFDACALDLDEKEFIKKVGEISPDILMIEVPTVTFPLVMRMLLEVENQINCKIIVTGPHVTALPNSTRYEILTGEWDRLLYTKPTDFTEYPFPNRKFFPNEQYSNFEFQSPSAQMTSSRGCLGNCTFCMERHVICTKNSIRCRTPKKVVDEMEYLKSIGAKQIWFDDMSITYKKGHMDNICKEILDRKLDMPWTCMGDMNCPEETIKHMSKSNCQGLAFGVETINPESLKLVNKRFVNPEKTKNFVKTLREHDIFSVATFIIGLPGETRKTMLKTIEFATEKLNADSIQFSIATPLPGTPFYRMCKKKGWLVTDDWTNYDGSRYSVVNYPELSKKEIEEFFRYAMKIREEGKLRFRK